VLQLKKDRFLWFCVWRKKRLKTTSRQVVELFISYFHSFVSEAARWNNLRVYINLNKCFVFVNETKARKRKLKQIQHNEDFTFSYFEMEEKKLSIEQTKQIGKS
jgi:hypothetical protein